MKRLLGAKDLCGEDLKFIFSRAEAWKADLGKDGQKNRLLSYWIPEDRKVLGLFFLQPSTRTKCGFEWAAQRLGWDVIDFSEGSAREKGEDVLDNLRACAAFCDVLVVRGVDRGTLEVFGNLCPGLGIINAGCDREHPTQALIDLFTIRHYNPGLQIFGMGGPNDRAMNSLFALLPGSRAFDFFWNIPLESCGVLYMTRQDIEPRDIHEDSKILTNRRLGQLPKDCIILHPLPRTGELPHYVDDDPRAKYWENMENGKYVRMGILEWMLK